MISKSDAVPCTGYAIDATYAPGDALNQPHDYAWELQAAVACAHAAGALLRDAFNGPGGAAAAGGAALDYEAEQLILRQLSAAFPGYGFRGEEAGLVRAPTESGDPRVPSRAWLVDPNEGTTAWLAGRRGAAVSIALLEGTRPVLGVVHAFNAPDDRGDTIAWAEGAALTRNGEPVVRTWPERAGGDQVVLLPPAACDDPEQAVGAVAPLRFACVPGVAYRLALVAVGEGDGALVTRGNMAADLAAGHALLAGAGGVLVDAWGEPLRYTRELGVSVRSDTFGGAPAVVAKLRAADWSLFAEPRSTTPAPVPGRGPVDAGVLARAQGCLLGQLCGDALGSLVEFQTPQQIAAAHPDGVRDLVDGGPFTLIAGQPTDDSELALALARTLVGADRYHAEAAWSAYEQWLLSRPFDVGQTLAQALGGQPRQQSQANGALMRISPLGVFGAGRDPRQVAGWAREDAALTHPNPVCGDVNALFAAAVALAVAEGCAPAALHARIVAWAEEWSVDREVRDLVARAVDAPPADCTDRMGWVLLAFHNALWQLAHAPSLEAALVDTVGRGGDTDTNAAICGALLGAVHGREAVPARWRRRVLTCRPSRQALGVRHPRPQSMWPCDALELAEALVVSGWPAAR